MGTTLKTIVEGYGNDSAKLMDILFDIQKEFNCISDEAVSQVAAQLKISEVDVMQTLSFYHYFSNKPVGKYAIYLNDSAVAKMQGRDEVAKAFEKASGCQFGTITEDGLIGLHSTADIGMNDQEPAAIINGKVFTSLTAQKATDIIAKIKEGKCVSELSDEKGEGVNSNELVNSMVKNNIKKEGKVIFSDYVAGTAVKKAVETDPQSVIDNVKTSNIKGRGGAGFPTGLKWDFCRKAEGDVKYVLCNADEGEPGTFKDRVLLTEKAEMLCEGMAVGAYAIGAKEGVIYLRGEYVYLKAYLENVIEELKGKNILGKNIAGKEGFDFDIRIQIGAGAYVCGEESALIESVEGKRGEPRNRPPFPVTKGYNNKPTIINNVETFCSISRIVEKGGEWYKEIGTTDSCGTKVLSISGDCKEAGVYEIEWGMTIKEMLEMVGAEKVQAVQVAGPSGICLNPAQFDRKIAIEDLPTGGSMIVVGEGRDLLKDLSLNFMEFMLDESCGSCTPCRTLNVLLKNKLEKVIDGKGNKTDLVDLASWCDVITKTTRCGLGQTSSNPIRTTLENFKEKYEALVADVEYTSDFDLAASVADSCDYVGRKPNA